MTSTTATNEKKKGGFKFQWTGCYYTSTYTEETGVFGPPVRHDSPDLVVHVASTAIHYGQACFEGLKAFKHSDGTVKLFRPQLNAARLARSAARVCLPAPSEQLFLDLVRLTVTENLAAVPDTGAGALYVRPFLFGSTGTLVLEPAPQAIFGVFVTPVGDYYPGGTVAALVVEDFNRAAPLGNGDVKLAGNYAPSLPSSIRAKQLGFPVTLFLDPLTQTMVDEFATSNFIAVTQDDVLVTPHSKSILRSITRTSLFDYAQKILGWKCEERPIPWSEVSTFKEVAACGTAVVVTPIGRIKRGDEEDLKFGEVMGPRISQLFSAIRAIQNGQQKDELGWMVEV